MHKHKGMSKFPRLAVILSALMAMGSPFASSADHLSGASHQLPPPQQVGVAYETNPPPLASLEGILGTNPTLDNLDLYVRSFARIAFEPESGGRLFYVAKWSHPIEIALTGRRSTDYDATLYIVAEQLVRITGLPINVQLLRNPRDKLLTPIQINIVVTDRFVGDFKTRMYCFFRAPKFDNNGLLSRINMVVSSNFLLDYLWACFHEDVSQAMGLFGDLAESEENMFRSEAENDKWPTFTWHDVIMLRTLYDRRIKPGMPEDQAMPIVRVIIAELLEELNAPAE